MIHETAILDGDVVVGDNTTIGAHCYIKGPAVIGKNNIIRPGTVIGTDAECRGKESVGRIVIGDNNIISDLVTIQRGIGDRDTQIGNDCYIMAHCHVAHDCLLEDEVTISAGAVMAGHVIVQKGAVIGIQAAIHQFSVIGAYAMVGMNSTITRDVPPFAMVFGAPTKIIGKNKYRIEKLKITNLEESDIYKDAMARFTQVSKRKSYR
jgi:UDP-N-acetylglucosamine acyltransferase